MTYQRKLFWTTVTVLFSLLLGAGGLLPSASGQAIANPAFPANANGRIMASEFGKWAFQSQNGISSGSQTVTLNSCYIKVGTAYTLFYPISTGAQLLIVDGANTETVTPTAVTLPTQITGPSTVSPYNCTFTATFSNSHSNAGFTVTSGDGGLGEAIQYAYGLGGGVITLDPSESGLTNALITTTPPYPNVQLEDLRTPGVQYWSIGQAAAALTAAPTTLTSSTVGFGINGANTTGGTYTGTSTYHVCIAYVDLMGQEGPCSADFSSLTAGTGSTNQIGIAAPAASTGQVGYTVYISLASGSYALAYNAPLTSANCTLTKVETVTPACAITNAAYGQTGSNAVISALTVNTAPLASLLGGANNQFTGNSNGRTTFAYTPGTRLGLLGVPSTSLSFTATAGTLSSTNPVVLGTVNLPAGLMNFAGKTIRVCGKITGTPSSTTAKENVLIYWDAAGSDSAGTPVSLANLESDATYSAAVFNGSFCETLTTTVAGSGATAGSVIGGQGYLTYGLASAPVGAPGIDRLNSATGSLNLANTSAPGSPTHLQIVQNHTTGSDGAFTLLNLTVEVL